MANLLNNSKIEWILNSHEKNLGDGFNVRRALPTVQKRMVGPFIFFDHMGPVDFVLGQGLDVRPHPHIGLSTLTYLFDGEILHRDTLGFEQLIEPGAVNLMTAGRGIAHSERSPAEARGRLHTLHGIQTWMALPKSEEERAPSFEHITAGDIPEISVAGSRVRVIVGSYKSQANTQSATSPVPVYSPMTYLHVSLKPNGKFDFSNSDHEIAIYVARGQVQLDSQNIQTGQLALIKKGQPFTMTALQTTDVLVLGGSPLNEERFIWWNFVSSSKERIEVAKKQWLNREFGSIRNEHEFIPLPTN